MSELVKYVRVYPLIDISIRFDCLSGYRIYVLTDQVGNSASVDCLNGCKVQQMNV